MTTVMASVQWQGAGQRHQLVESLRAYLDGAVYPIDETPIDPATGDTRQGVKHLDEIRANISAQMTHLEALAPSRLLTLSCECSGDIAPIAYFARRHADLRILWVDAHADLNTPASSPSGDFHGMPLRTLLGEGPQPILDLLSIHLTPKQVGLVGVRDCDPGEQDFIASRRIRHWLDLSVSARAEIETFVTGKPIYIHFDLDVLDPDDESLALFKTPDGLSYPDLGRWLSSLALHHTVVGMGLFEYHDPIGEFRERYAEIVELCRRCLGTDLPG
ncbi:arginase family protein [Salinicola endophyticus]|uniref:Arginase family protein n=1 Tax=Salinicola endophyticus TaxID=1949083 RepID=A0AB74UHQ3_9GAMM